MYLFIDAGNTRIKYAGHDGEDWSFQQFVPSDGSVPLSLPASFLPARVLAVSVAGDAARRFIEQALQPLGVPVEWFCSSAACAGLRNAYTDPERLGADRWAAAIAAWHRVKAACLVIGAGTATTIDVISAEGVFEGGCILPGLDMMRRALASGTSDLPLAAGHFAALPRNTHDAIFSGCLNAQVGAIARMRQQLPAGAPLLLAGGAGPALRAGLDGQVIEAPWLVIEGLLRVATFP